MRTHRIACGRRAGEQLLSSEARDGLIEKCGSPDCKVVKRFEAPRRFGGTNLNRRRSQSRSRQTVLRTVVKPSRFGGTNTKRCALRPPRPADFQNVGQLGLQSCGLLFRGDIEIWGRSAVMTLKSDVGVPWHRVVRVAPAFSPRTQRLHSALLWHVQGAGSISPAAKNLSCPPPDSCRQAILCFPVSFVCFFRLGKAWSRGWDNFSGSYFRTARPHTIPYYTTLYCTIIYCTILYIFLNKKHVWQ